MNFVNWDRVEFICRLLRNNSFLTSSHYEIKTNYPEINALNQICNFENSFVSRTGIQIGDRLFPLHSIHMVQENGNRNLNYLERSHTIQVSTIFIMTVGGEYGSAIFVVRQYQKSGERIIIDLKDIRLQSYEIYYPKGIHG